MSAHHPEQDPHATGADALGAMYSRLQAAERELQALREENRHLRLECDRQAVSPDLALKAELPRPPDSKVHAFGSDAPHLLTSQLDYEALLAAMSSVFPIGIFRTDSAGTLTHIDGALQRIFELSPSEFQNYGWFRRVHPEDLETVKAAWAKGIVDGSQLSLEFRLLHPEDRVSYVLARNSPVLSAEGRVLAQHGFVQDITSLRELQAQARIKDELNHQIIASSPDCTKVLDLKGHVIQMTAQGCRLVEVDRFEDVKGTDWSTWWEGESYTLAREALDAAAQGESTRFVAFGKTFKGTPKWWDTVVTPIADAHDRPVMLMAVSRDITDLYRHQQEIESLNAGLESRVLLRTQELAEANEHIGQALHQAQLLYQQAPCGYHSVNAQGRYVRVNQTELDWLDYTEDEVVGKLHFRDFVRPDQVPMIMERLQRVIRNEAVPSVEVCLQRRDGSEMWVLLSTTAVVNDDGSFLHTNNTLVDITASRMAEAALSAQRGFLQNIADGVAVQLAFYDRDLICRFANASYARWVGTEPAALLGMHLSEIARPEDFQQGQPHLEATLNGEGRRFEGQREFPDGHRFYASIEYAPYIEQGTVQGLFIQMLDISERRAAEMQVTEANQHLSEALQLSQSLYNEAPCGYHSLDMHGIYVSINDTELRWLGYTRHEVVGKMGFQNFILPQRRQLLEDRLQRLIESGTLETAEYEMRRRDGSVFPALLSSSAVRDASGQFLRSNTTVVDITERKAAEIALRDSQHFLYAITEHVPGMVAYLDADLRFRFANAEHTRINGFTPEEMIGKRASECLPPEVWDETEHRFRAALAGQTQQFEAWRTRIDGQRIFVSGNYLPDIRDGEVHGIFVQVNDITDRKRIEERISHLNEELESRIKERSLELLESEQRFRLMVDNLREYCIFFIDTQGNVTDWTDSAQRMEGNTPTETLGKHYSMLFRRKKPDEAREIGDRLLRTAVSRGQNELHGWYERKDGSSYWAHSVIIALRDQSGELRGFAKINRDMSDAKRLDDLMRNINEELENRVIDRTEQLTAANKDLESFSYSVSHDLRSPLRHISSFVSLLEEHLGESRDEVALRYLGTIGNSARHMSQLIDGLLSFSRLGRAAVNLIDVDFTQLVQAVVAQLAHDTQGRHVEWAIAPDLPVVQGDPLLLREVWTNLIGNALKYSRPRETARIEISWSVDPAVGYIFAVGDNGVGFDPQYAQKLFGVFQRLHRASEFEGTGIGLALVRRILDRHGGSIWAESRMGEGSTFSFSLPFEGASPLGLTSESLSSMLES
jgi:PAS domain S-box-containing protein